MPETLTYTTKLASLTCGVCEIPFAMPADMLKGAQRDGRLIWCPNGHQIHYLETENEVLQAKLERAERRRGQLDAQLTHERDQRHAAERSRNPAMTTDTGPAEIAGTVLERTDARDYCVVSLTAGWTEGLPPYGRMPVAGDLIIIIVSTLPDVPVTGPAGWTLASSSPAVTAWYRVIGPGELNPLFRCPRPVSWMWQARAYTGLTHPFSGDWATTPTVG